MCSAPSAATIDVVSLRKSYAERPVLSDLTFAVASGEILAIVGPSGTGKSTLLRCLNGVEHIDSGLIRISGSGDEDLRDGTVRLPDRVASRRRARVGLVLQGFHLFSHMTVLENLIEAPIVVAGLLRRDAEERAMSLLDKFGLVGRHNDFPRNLSGGEQQRVAIVRALVMEPPVVLLDEPTSALDRHRSDWLGAHLRDLAASGTTIVVTTHNIGFAKRTADRVLVLEAGRILKEGSPHDVLDDRESTRCPTSLFPAT